tara:strand:- start:149 stop:502 length:354 start_codon:yes stop_codon:yes gene_type:complete
MNKPVKAALLSALIIPGAGHFFLKRTLSGVVLAGVAVVALYVLVSSVVERALELVNKIQRGEVSPDIAAMTELVIKQPMGAEAQAINIATLTLMVVWLVAVVDSYRVGRLEERNTGN